MASGIRNADVLRKRVDGLTGALVKRFENIVAQASIERTDFNSTAHKAYQLEVEITALIRAAEEILALTRQMQEMWLFGQLDTVRTNEKFKETEERARTLAGLVEGFVKGLGVGGDVGERSGGEGGAGAGGGGGGGSEENL